jgi:signal transduction histidine kinase
MTMTAALGGYAVWFLGLSVFTAVALGAVALRFWSLHKTYRHRHSMKSLDLEMALTKVDRYSALVELVNSISLESSLEEAGETCLHTALKVSGTDAGVVYLFDKRRNEVQVIAELGFSDHIDNKLNSHLIVAVNPEVTFQATVFFGSYKSYVKEHMVSVDGKVSAKGIAVLPLVEDSRADLCLQIYSYSSDAFAPDVRNVLEDMRSLTAGALHRLIAASNLTENLAVSNARYKTVESLLENLGFEVRTSLQDLVGAAEVLQVSELNPVQEGLVKIVIDTGVALQETVNHVIEFSHMEDSSLALSEVEVDLYKLLEDVLNVFRQRAHFQDVDLSLSLDSRVPRVLICDGDRIRQILVNLLGVALRHSLLGTLTISVTAEVGVSDDITLRFGISDTGVGISKGKLQSFFSSLMASQDGKAEAMHQGGIALAVAKRLVEVMGGEIDVEPADTQGAAFWFTVRARVRDLFEPQRASEVPLSGFDINQFFPPDLDVWNRVELLERLGGDKNILSHLKALFDSTTPDRMLALRQASVRRDWDAMEKVSHELKGVAQNLVMPSFLEALKDLRSAIAEHASENTIARKVAFVGEAFEKARKEKV